MAGQNPSTVPGFSSTFQLWIAELGAAVIAPNVRGSSGYGKQYVKLDNGFLREDSVKGHRGAARLDRDAAGSRRKAAWQSMGGSYGGYMVLASLMHYSDRLEAAVDIVGVSNFVTFLENTQGLPAGTCDAWSMATSGIRRCERIWRRSLQATTPSASRCRCLSPRVKNDPRVPITEAVQIVKAVRDAGFDVWYMNAVNEGHGFPQERESGPLQPDRRDVPQATSVGRRGGVSRLNRGASQPGEG